jgi:hypothetical protein
VTTQNRVGTDFFENRPQHPATDGEATGVTIPSQAPTQITMESKGFNLGERLAAADAAKTPMDISVEELLLVELLRQLRIRPNLSLDYFSLTLLSTEDKTFIEELRTTDGVARTAFLKKAFNIS